MGDPCEREREGRRTTCIVCTFLLVGILLLLLILYFALFKPKDPRVQVPTMQLLSCSPIANEGAAASLSLNLQVSLYNPNRGDFIIQDGSTACLYYQNQQVGFTPIPQGIIPALSFSTASVRLSTSSPIPLIPDASTVTYAGANSINNNVLPAAANVLPISTSVTIVGHVTNVNLFSHHSDVISKCKVALSLPTTSGSASIQSYSCQSSYSLDD